MHKTLLGIYKRTSLRFVVVGASNFLITYIVYMIALSFVNYHVAYFIGLAVALVFTTILNIRHTFSRNLSFKSSTGYGIYYLLYSYASYKIVELLVENLSIDERIALLVAIIIATPIHFLLSRKLVSVFD